MYDCKKIQNMIVPFEHKKLSLQEEEAFIEHLTQCKDCREEFEIYYIVTYGLEDDDKVSQIDPECKALFDCYDFTGVVDYKIKNSLLKVNQIKKQNYYNRIAWLTSNICLVAVLLIYIVIKYY